MKIPYSYSDSHQIYQYLYRISIISYRRAQCVNIPTFRPCSLKVKHIYTITKRSSLPFTENSRCYIFKKLIHLYEKQQNIPHLCRIYGVSLSKLQPLFKTQATLTHLLWQWLQQDKNPAKAERTVSALLDACKEQKHHSLQFAKSAPTLAIHKQLMLKDIADEFICCANTITQMVAVILMEQTRYQKKV